LADSTPFDPYETSKMRTYGQIAAPAKAGEANGEKEFATGVSEARSHQRRGKTTPTPVTLRIRS
jgi:hypothetical protein